MSNNSAPAVAGQPAPTDAEVALRNRIAALKTITAELHGDLQTYGSSLGPEAAASQQKLADAIKTHAVATDFFCNAAHACVPPIR